MKRATDSYEHHQDPKQLCESAGENLLFAFCSKLKRGEGFTMYLGHAAAVQVLIRILCLCQQKQNRTEIALHVGSYDVDLLDCMSGFSSSHGS